MNQRAKQRVVGAVVLVALAVIFIPMLLTGPVEREASDVPIAIPPQPVLGEAPGVAGPAGDEPPMVPMSASTPVETATESAPPQPEALPAPVVAADEPADTSPARTPPELASWAVQVGSFGGESNALGLRDRLREKGYPTYVDSVESKGKTYFRVRVGPIIQRAEAEATQARLAKEEQLQGLVRPHS